MRLTIEALGLTFVMAFEQDTQDKPEPMRHENLEATTERANAFDFNDRPPVRLRLGFAGTRKP